MTTRFTSLEAAADAAGVYHARWAGNSAHDLMLHVYQSNPDDFPDDKADWLADLAGDLAEALVNNEERLGVDKGALNRDLVFIAPVVAGDEVELQLACPCNHRPNKLHRQFRPPEKETVDRRMP